MFCNKCGKEIDDAAKFCPYCGEPFAAQENVSESAPKGTGKKTVGMIAIAVTGILLIGCFVFLVIQLCSKNTSEAPSKQEQKATTEHTATTVENTEKEQDIITDSLDIRTEPWKELYRDFIRQESQEYQRIYSGYDSGVEYDDNSYMYRYGLAYIDEDDVPELVLQYLYPNMGKWDMIVYTCVDDTVTPLYEGGWMFDIQYVDRKGKLCITDMTGYQYRERHYYDYEAGQINEVFHVYMEDTDADYDDLETVDSLYVDDNPISVQDLKLKLDELGLSSMKNVELIDVSEENVNNSFEADWIYTNYEFGYSLLIPASFSKSEQESGYEEGALFNNDMGACLKAVGYNNDTLDTPESIVNGYPEASYTYIGDNYCCISYVDGTDIVYKAYRIDSNLVYGFEIIYSQENKELYDNIINNMLHYLVNE
ncbi:MAG: zinc-ribbon domain-containing protein [Lachnospiraceae bacterium]